MIQKNCENCRYYVQYYIKRNSKYSSCSCGTCINFSIKKSQRKTNGNCDFWEDMIIKELERKKSIQKVLEEMSEHLNDIAQILKDS